MLERLALSSSPSPRPGRGEGNPPLKEPRNSPLDPGHNMEEAMPNDLYEHDILAWSERQADQLRRVAGDERHGGVDWPRVIEEIEAVGTAQLNDVRGMIRQTMICLLGMHFGRDDVARPDRMLELACLFDDVAEQFTPSMRQRIDLDMLWHRIRTRTVQRLSEDPRARALPDHCPWTLDALLANDHDGLLAALAGWPVAPARR